MDVVFLLSFLGSEFCYPINCIFTNVFLILTKKITMKKIILAIAVFSALGLNAQTIPNNGFEDWTFPFPFEDPNDWATLNVISFLGGPISTTKSTDAHSGSFSAKSVSFEADISGSGTMDSLAGIMFIGSIDFASQSSVQGIAFNYKPDSLIVWTKSNLLSGDSSAIQVSLTKWNAATMSQDQIAQGFYLEEQSSSTFKRVSIPIEYNSAEAPDTMAIFVLSGISAIHPGSAIWVDDFSFVYNSASVEEIGGVSCSFFPNPADHVLTISAVKDENIEVLTAAGVKVDAFVLFENETKQLNTAEYPSGVYFLKSEAGIVQKFTVKH